MSTLLTLLILVGAPALGVYLWLKLVKSVRGEDYLKLRMQGPFVPLDEDKK